jgi:hypothetical protein
MFSGLTSARAGIDDIITNTASQSLENFITDTIIHRVYCLLVTVF